MSVGTILLAILAVALCIAVALVGSYLDSGDWLWKSSDKEDRRNWAPRQ